MTVSEAPYSLDGYSDGESWQPHSRANGESLSVPHHIASYWRFLMAGLLKHGQTGAFVPSQRFLINKMIAPVPTDYTGRVIELGAGTGALTFRLAARCPQAHILACEINEALARDLERAVAKKGLSRRVEITSESAEDLLAKLRGANRPEFILSGIPLGNLPGNRVVALLDRIRRALRPEGTYVQFQYLLLDWGKIRANFSRLRITPVLMNVPPAFVYYARK